MDVVLPQVDVDVAGDGALEGAVVPAKLLQCAGDGGLSRLRRRCVQRRAAE